ncbi:MAG: hypothetical protein OEW04_12330, partial [Nitrospirota bacterium]|nr:hypothetical protein [Nitrospirota bacterium]
MERGCRGSIISLAVLSIVLLLLSLNLPFVAYAFEPDLEKELQQSLIQSRAVINRAEKKLKDSLPLDNEIIKLKEVAKSVNITNALMQERFRLRREEVKSLGAKAQERHRVMEEGYLRALEEYLALMEG